MNSPRAGRRAGYQLIIILGLAGAAIMSPGDRSRADSSKLAEQSSQPAQASGPVASTQQRLKRARAVYRKSPDQLQARQIGHGRYSYEVVEDELLIRPNEGVSFRALETLVKRLGGSVLEQSGRSGLCRLRVPTSMPQTTFEAALRQSSLVADVTPNAITSGAGCPNGTYRARAWDLDLIQEAAACAAYAPGLATVVVAVLDTGVAYENYSDSLGTYKKAPDFTNVTFVPGYDFVNNDAHPNDDHQHGTHMTGIIASQGAAAGVAPGVQIMPIKVLNRNEQGTELQLVQGIYYAVDHGADVINMSMSFGLGYFPTSSLQEAIAYAVDHGVVLVGSAGNAGQVGVSYPGAFQDVISVGAGRMDKANNAYLDLQAFYSNYGYRLDLMAPGGQIDKDINADNYPDAVVAPSFAKNNPSSLGYWYGTGTSQAAAHVSGIAAWLLADGAPPALIKSLLQSSASPMGSTQFEPEVGSGHVQLQSARTMYANNSMPAPPVYYVDMIGYLRSGSEDPYAEIRLQVIDSKGMPVPNALVAGTFFGSGTQFDETAITDSNGFATIQSDEVCGDYGVAIGFQVDFIGLAGQRVVAAPIQFFSLSPAYAELYARMLQDTSGKSTVIMYKLDPKDTGLGAAIPDASSIRLSYLMKPVGAGLRTGPMVVIIDDTLAPEITRPSSTVSKSVTWSWPSALYSGRGLVTQVTGLEVNASSSKLGSAIRYYLLPLDPAMGKVDLNHCYPVLNAFGSVFQAVNRTFGNGFAASALGSGFASSSMGSGFASSSLGDGFAASALGSGFAASALGSGFAASAMGSGFASSSLGAGFASSSIAAGLSWSYGNNYTDLSQAVGTGQTGNGVGFTQVK